MIFSSIVVRDTKQRVRLPALPQALGRGWALLSLFPSFVKELVFAKTESLITVVLFLFY